MLSSPSGSEPEQPPKHPLLQPVGLPGTFLRLLYVSADNPAYLHKSPLRLWVFLCLVAAPWIWVAWGLFVLHDYRAAVALYSLLCCLLPALILARDESGFRVAPLNMPWWFVALLTIASFIFLIGGWHDLGPHLVNSAFIGQRLNQIHLLPDHFLPFAVYLVVVNPLVEELFWRGLVYRELKRVTRPWIALLLSSFFFGFWHWIIIQHLFAPAYVPLVVGCVMFGGIVFGLVYEKTGTLLAPAIVHGLGADLPLVIMLYQCMHCCMYHAM